MQVRSAELFFVSEFLLKTETRSRYKKRVVIQQLLKKPTPSLFLYICINRCAKEAHSDPTLNTFIM